MGRFFITVRMYVCTYDGKVDLVVPGWRIFIVHATAIDALILDE